MDTYTRYQVSKHGHLVTVTAQKHEPLRANRCSGAIGRVLYNNTEYAVQLGCTIYRGGEPIQMLYSSEYDKMASPKYNYIVDAYIILISGGLMVGLSLLGVLWPE